MRKNGNRNVWTGSREEMKVPANIVLRQWETAQGLMR